jgi:nucleoside-diphosphate-sugar epimerase
MDVFVAGGTGAVGRRLIPLLVQSGHRVVALTRRPERAPDLERMGAVAAVADALDRDALGDAVTRAHPQVVVHELTALAGLRDFQHLDRSFAATNRLRTEGTDNLLAAARAAGASRFIAQSYAGWPYARTGGPVKSEDDPLDPDPPRRARQSLAAIRHLERAVLEAPGIAGLVLRYGGLYGPGTSLAPGGEQFQDLHRRRFPIVGRGGGVWSFVHVDDAAQATALAVDRGAPGLYNVVDDEPAPVATWLPALAWEISAPPPRRVPAWLARVAAGDYVVTAMTEVRGASNAKAKRELGWELMHPSWRRGFAALASGARSGPRAPAGRGARAVLR